MSKTYDELKRAEYSRHGGNILSANLRIKGEISGNEDLLVQGIVEGPIQLEDGILTVGATGKIISNVVAREVIIYGEVRGNLAARDRIEIKKEGSIVGDLTATRITIEDGATVKGSIEIIRKDRSTDASDPEQLGRAFKAAG